MRHVPESKTPRAPDHVIETLKEVVAILKMERNGGPHFSMDKAESDRIREAIRPWVSTWSLAPLEDLLAWAQGAPGTIEDTSHGPTFWKSPTWRPQSGAGKER